MSAEVRKAGIDPAQVPARLLITEYGTRIALRATLPTEHAFTPDDGHSMALTFECFNSVDGTVPLFAAVGWFRFVCSNGLVVGTTSAKVRQRHLPPLDIGEVSGVLADGMEAALSDETSFKRWRATKVPAADLVRWVDGPVADTWGPLAAARVYGISTTGCDGAPVKRFKKMAPHRWEMTRRTRGARHTRTMRGRLRDCAGPGLDRRPARRRLGTAAMARTDSRPALISHQVNQIGLGPTQQEPQCIADTLISYTQETQCTPRDTPPPQPQPRSPHSPSNAAHPDTRTSTSLSTSAASATPTSTSARTNGG